MNFNATLYCVAEPNFVIRPKNNRPIQTRPSIKDFEIWYLNPPITIDFYGNGPDPDTSSLTFNPLKGTMSRLGHVGLGVGPGRAGLGRVSPKS